MTFSGTGGTLSYQAPDGTWHDLGPVTEEAMTAIAGAVKCFESLGTVTATVTGVITEFHWNRMCRAFGFPVSWYRYPSTPLRPRKHGGRLPSYRDVRQKWHTT